MESHITHSLGHRAFFIFLFRRIKMSLFLFLLAGLTWYYRSAVSAAYVTWMDFAWKTILLIATVFFSAILLWTYLEYNRHTYRFGEEAFMVMCGYVVRDEVAVVYHHIQSVNIRRKPMDRIVGVSQIVIIMTGTDRESQRSQIVLPALARDKARLVQNELLARARKHAISSG